MLLDIWPVFKKIVWTDVGKNYHKVLIPISVGYIKKIILGTLTLKTEFQMLIGKQLNKK